MFCFIVDIIGVCPYGFICWDCIVFFWILWIVNHRLSFFDFCDDVFIGIFARRSQVNGGSVSVGMVDGENTFRWIEYRMISDDVGVIDVIL